MRKIFGTLLFATAAILGLGSHGMLNHQPQSGSDIVLGLLAGLGACGAGVIGLILFFGGGSGPDGGDAFDDVDIDID